MNPRRLLAVARKEAIHIRRDTRSLILALAIPMLLLLLFGYALTLDVDNVPLVVWDQNGTNLSRDFVAQFQASRYFSLQATTDNYRDIEEALNTGEAMLGVVIPYDFSDRLEAGRPVDVQVLLDGADATTASLAKGYAEAVAALYSRQIILRESRLPVAALPKAPVEMRPRVWFNPDLNSRNYIVPGLIAVILMVIAAMLTSLTVAREWEQGTMEQLISTPVKGTELIVGKLIPYLVIGAFDVLMVVLTGQYIFHVPLHGNVALLALMTVIFLVGALSLGLLISVLTKAQLLSSQLAVVLTYLPTLLLSGFVFDIRNMPVVVQVITYIFPSRYFISLLKGIYLKGIGLEVLWLEALLMSIFATLMVALSVRKFHKRLA